MINTNSADQIHRFIFDDADIRGEIVSLQSSYQEACAHQQLPPTVQILVGEFLAAVSLLSEILKFTGTITLQAQGNGPVPMIMADTTHTRNLRGIAKISDDCSAPALEGCNLAQLIGDGVLTLTMDPEQGQRYQGVIELSRGTLAECLTDYFTQSEQVPTRIWLFSNPKQAGGILLQALPRQSKNNGNNEQTHQDRWATAVQLAKTVTKQELFQIDHTSLLGRLFNHEFQIRLFEPHSLQFVCHCSAERCAHTLSSLGKKDAYNLLEEQGAINVDCEFCGNRYIFTKPDLTAIFTD